ncbi:MAG: 4-phosphoerythronate dehydrogenase [Bacteroidota bacterium]
MTAVSPRSGALRIVADENIPLTTEVFETLGSVHRIPGRAITPESLVGADVLLVRSVTRVDASLLQGSTVGFVGSATIGVDHVDRVALAKRGTRFAHAPGSNAGSVVEYVLAALMHVAVLTKQPLRGQTLGVIGHGHIGQPLARRAAAFGLRVLLNDPPLAERGAEEGLYHDLHQVLTQADIVSIHVPLERGGAHPTHHLLGATTLAHMKPGAWLINASRGPVVDNHALLNHAEAGRLGALVLDVWEDEPTPLPALVHAATLATPHIAGYSYDGKVAGTRMLYEAVLDWLGEPPAPDALAALDGDSEGLTPLRPRAAPDEAAWLHHLGRQLYDIEADDRRFRLITERPAHEAAAYFQQLRKTYPRRRAFERHRLDPAAIPPAYQRTVEEGLLVGQ